VSRLKPHVQTFSYLRTLVLLASPEQGLHHALDRFAAASD